MLAEEVSAAAKQAGMTIGWHQDQAPA